MDVDYDVAAERTGEVGHSLHLGQTRHSLPPQAGQRTASSSLMRAFKHSGHSSGSWTCSLPNIPRSTHALTQFCFNEDRFWFGGHPCFAFYFCFGASPRGFIPKAISVIDGIAEWTYHLFIWCSFAFLLIVGHGRILGKNVTTATAYPIRNQTMALSAFSAVVILLRLLLDHRFAARDLNVHSAWFLL